MLGVAGAASLLACALSPAGALAAGCPNEPIREQQHVTALLPDCRAYEMVTPVNKNDQEATVPFYTTADEVPFQASARGPGSTFTMTGGFPGSESTAQFAVGIGTGGAPGSPWSDLALSPETRFGRLGTEGTRHSGDFLHYSPTLSCGVETTALPQAKNHGEETPEIAPGELPSDEVQRLYMWKAPAGVPPSESRAAPTPSSPAPGRANRAVPTPAEAGRSTAPPKTARTSPSKRANTATNFR